jgi:hypothetical protein
MRRLFLVFLATLRSDCIKIEPSHKRYEIELELGVIYDPQRDAKPEYRERRRGDAALGLQSPGRSVARSGFVRASPG